tara:strand:- start:97 stop:369 length:273 start_codon:yes stop_codon:yes gene_type:complete
MFGFGKKKLHKSEGERAARRLAEITTYRELSYLDFVKQSEKLVPEALSSVGISQDLSNKAKAEIALLAWEMTKEEYSEAEVSFLLKSFKD